MPSAPAAVAHARVARASRRTTMHEAQTDERLACAAAQLCLAYEELAAAGYNGWSSEIRMLTDIIDAEIHWLRECHSTPAGGA
jgi:hypothetical protein